MKSAADRSNRWADKNENTKIGFDPIKEHDRSKDTRAYIGAKTKKMQSRVTHFERRMEKEIEEKEGLLQDIENPAVLRLNPLRYYKERLISCRDFTVGYSGAAEPVLKDFSFELMQGERVFLQGENGCGKSTLIQAILGQDESIPRRVSICTEGQMKVASNLIISYIHQDTSFLKGNIKDFCKERKLGESLFFTLLKKLDLERVQFRKNLEELSEGQKKKVLIAASLMTPAHVYIWDEPLNYIDVFSRMQIEELILTCQPTMILVDHDVRFRDKIATRVVKL